MNKIQSLIKELNSATIAYDNGHPIMTDQEWDDKYYKLMQLEKENNIIYPNSPTQKIIYKEIPNLTKVTHNHKMLSLDKTKGWNEFLNYFTSICSWKDVTGMIKLDGLTLSLRYINGNLVSAETRGDGEVGEDVLHNALVVNSIPSSINYTDELIIDGEIICTYKDFDNFSSTYSHPRNFASGSIRLLDSAECAKRNLTFVAWNIVKGFDETNSFIEKLTKLNNLGFEIVPWTSSFDWDAKEFLVEEANELGYPIDGLVGRFDDIEYGQSLGETSHHPRAAYAFKFYDETYPTYLKDIEWSVGRTGQITPVAIFEPVEIEGTIVERSSLHNISIIRELLGDAPFKGQEIWVSKRNMIIPQIEKAKISNLADWTTDRGYILNLPTICPICGGEVKTLESNSGVLNLYCVNNECDGKLINRLDYFCSRDKGLDIRGLSKATLEKLIDWGWVNNIVDIYSLHKHRAEWEKKPGFGKKSVDNILTAIENSIDCELYAFISALGIPLVGHTYAKLLAKYNYDWANFKKCINEKFNFSQIDGIGPEINDAILSFDYTDADLLANILIISNSLYIDSDTPSQTLSLSNTNFCITGKLNSYKRAELQALIEQKGGKVLSAVSKNTSYLINNDNTSTSSKNLSAQKLNIPIITEQEFIEKFL